MRDDKERRIDMNEQWGVGNAAESKSFDTTMVGDFEVELIHGQHPHSRCDNSMYARFPDGRIEGFDGHRLLHEIRFEDHNYLKQSGLSGNEVRKGGSCKIIINGFICKEFFYRDVTEALITARSALAKIHEHPVRLWDEADRKRLIGRKVYYHDFPAIVEMLIKDQACVILKPDHADRAVFPPRPYELEDASRGDGDIDWGERKTAKVEIDSPHIWWWRESGN